MDRSLPAIVARAFGKKPPKKTGETCALCGGKTATLEYKAVVKPTLKEQIFMDSACGFCTDCAFIWEPQFRSKNWIIKAKPETVPHAEVWQWLLRPIDPPYVISLTTSYKKHNLVYGFANHLRSDTRMVVWDQKSVRYDIVDDAILFDTVHDFYNNLGQNKAAIKSGDYNVTKLDDKTYKAIKEKERTILRRYRNTGVFNLAVTYVQKEIKTK